MKLKKPFKVVRRQMSRCFVVDADEKLVCALQAGQAHWNEIADLIAEALNEKGTDMSARNPSKDETIGLLLDRARMAEAENARLRDIVELAKKALPPDAYSPEAAQTTVGKLAKAIETWESGE